MLGSLSFMNNNTNQQFQAPVLSESSSGSALLQKAGLMNSTATAPLPSYFSGMAMKTPTNLFQTQQQEHMLPPAPAPSFLTPIPNLKPVPATSYFRNFADSTDSYSWQKGKAPAGLVNYFADSTMAPGIIPPGNPIQSLVNPYTLSGNIGASNGRMMETVSLPPRPMARPEVMRQNEEEVFDDGITMDLLRLQEEGGCQFHQAEGTNTTFSANNDRFFGGVNGCPKHFW